ncbi:MAG TPA: DNA-3-methyladenine glycosylase [Pseudogracilibacillus sp.]|nr:DNA-3-methyladenine glycosylase [Pseudogracilibacillus sp.]
MFKAVDRSFFQAPCLDLAKNLLGQYIVHHIEHRQLVARIVETEAYLGPDDRAAHSFENRRTKRTEIMFNKPGLVYTYQMHTHTLVNVVASPIDTPHAILIRAVEPTVGEDLMQENRGVHITGVNLTNGPGKLAKALGISMDYYGHDWTEKPLFIAEGTPAKYIEVSPRVGIGNAGEAVHYPWRFYEKDNPYVSKYRK